MAITWSQADSIGEGTRPVSDIQEAGAIARAVRALATLFLLLLPFSTVNLASFAGEIGMNLAFPILLLLAPLTLFYMLPLPFSAVLGNPFERLLRALLWFFVWCAFDTLLTGIVFEGGGIAAYGTRPLAHSLQRLPIPLILALTIFVAYYIGLRVLSPASIDRILLASVAAVGAYGLVQLYAHAFSPDWYSHIAGWIEAGRNRAGRWNATDLAGDYVAQSGRINLTTFEAAEAARLLLILYIPVLASPLLRASRVSYRRILLVFYLVALIFAAQTFVGLAGLLALVAVSVALLPGKARIQIIGALSVALVVGLLCLPEQFTQRLSGIGSTQNVSELDQSGVTRAAFASASLKVAAEHPILGIGWSKDIFFLPDAIPSWGLTWEVTQSLANGEAVAAKSMALRLLLYSGFPACACLLFVYLRSLLQAIALYRKTQHPLLLRLVFVLASFGVCGSIDGGILAGFYSWAALGLSLGLASKTVAEAKA